MPFTFKTNQPTGRYRSFDNPTHDIKLKGSVVGGIDHKSFKIRLCVIKADPMEDGSPNCKWKHCTLAYSPASLNDAKEYINTNIERILRMNLYLSADHDKR